MVHLVLKCSGNPNPLTFNFSGSFDAKSKRYSVCVWVGGVLYGAVGPGVWLL